MPPAFAGETSYCPDHLPVLGGRFQQQSQFASQSGPRDSQSLARQHLIVFEMVKNPTEEYAVDVGVDLAIDVVAFRLNQAIREAGHIQSI